MAITVGNKTGFPSASVGLVTDVDTVQRNQLGMHQWDDLGNEFIYLAGVASLVAGDWVHYNTTTTFVAVRLVTTATLAAPVAVAVSAVLAANWGWFQIYGVVSQANIATVAVNKLALYTSTTAGRATTVAGAATAIFNAAQSDASVANLGPAMLAHPYTLGTSTL
jgi:hypothetical protein